MFSVSLLDPPMSFDFIFVNLRSLMHFNPQSWLQQSNHQLASLPKLRVTSLWIGHPLIKFRTTITHTPRLHRSIELLDYWYQKPPPTRVPTPHIEPYYIPNHTDLNYEIDQYNGPWQPRSCYGGEPPTGVFDPSLWLGSRIHHERPHRGKACNDIHKLCRFFSRFLRCISS